MRLFSIPALALVCLGISLNAVADELQIPDDAPQMGESPSMEMPAKGMHEDKVRAKFGEPNRIIPPVGDPPITRWVYDDYTVYFEYSYVIHSVSNLKLNRAAPPIYSVDVDKINAE